MNSNLDTRQLSDWLPTVMDVADSAGREIMRIYRTAFGVTLKDDRSPLTEADLAAQRIIAAGLAALTPDIAMLGEESPPQQFDTLPLSDAPVAMQPHFPAVTLAEQQFEPSSVAGSSLSPGGMHAHFPPFATCEQQFEPLSPAG